MSVSVQAIPMFSDNYAWLLRESASGAVGIADPADAEAVITAIDAAGGRLDTIFLTHHHADHVAGTDQVRARYHATVIGARADAHRLPKLDIAVGEGDPLAFGATAVQVIATPGHTRGHLAFFFPDGDILLSGDTLFSLGCGRLLEGTAAEMFTSLQKLAALPPDTLVCCGHEYTQSNARFAPHHRARQPGPARPRRRSIPPARSRPVHGPIAPRRRTCRKSLPSRPEHPTTRRNPRRQRPLLKTRGWTYREKKLFSTAPRHAQFRRLFHRLPRTIPRQIRRQRMREVRQRQGLQPDPPRPGQLSQEQPVAAEKTGC